MKTYSKKQILFTLSIAFAMTSAFSVVERNIDSKMGKYTNSKKRSLNYNLKESVRNVVDAFKYAKDKDNFLLIEMDLSGKNSSMKIKTYYLEYSNIVKKEKEVNMSGNALYKHFFNIFVVNPKLLTKACENINKNSYLTKEQSKPMADLINMMKNCTRDIEKIFNDNSKMLKKNGRNSILEALNAIGNDKSCINENGKCILNLKNTKSGKKLIDFFEKQINPIIDNFMYAGFKNIELVFKASKNIEKKSYFSGSSFVSICDDIINNPKKYSKELVNAEKLRRIEDAIKSEEESDDDDDEKYFD